MNKPFYGWFVLLGLFMVYMATNGILLNTLPLFYPNLMAEFGWDEAQVTAPFSIFFVLIAVLSPLGGMLADRFNPRWLMFAGVTTIVITLATYPLIQTLPQLIIVYLVLGLGLSTCGMVTSLIMITRWFHRLRGRAVGIFLMASSFGGAVFPLMARQTLSNEGWREAIWLLAIVGGLLTIIPVLLLVRSHPHEKGLHADGADVDAPDVTLLADKPNYGPYSNSSSQPARFYLIAFVTGTLWFCFVGVLQHQLIFFEQAMAIEKSTLPLIASTLFWAAIVGKLLFGWLADRFNIPLMMFVAVLSLAAGLGLLTFLSLHGGPEDTSLSFRLRDYFWSRL